MCLLKSPTMFLVQAGGVYLLVGGTTVSARECALVPT